MNFLYIDDIMFKPNKKRGKVEQKQIDNDNKMDKSDFCLSYDCQIYVWIRKVCTNNDSLIDDVLGSGFIWMDESGFIATF